jgi:hypothetical protein
MKIIWRQLTESDNRKDASTQTSHRNEMMQKGIMKF